MINFYNICWYFLAQTQVQTSETTADGGVAGEELANKTPSLFDSWMFPALMAVMLVYFIMMARPKNKAQAKTSDLLANLKKNDKVVTAGGILGTVVNHRSDAEYVTLRVDEATNSKMQVLAKSIVRVVSDEDAADS
ncbi:MAG: preprotein translocase subunit YajC [Planctomycetaceae bacterium]|nr:preprotein translocase subunit YajC [Planctomycetaceae bacterium]